MSGTSIVANEALLDELFDDIAMEELSGFQGDNEIYNIAGEVVTHEVGTWHVSKEEIELNGRRLSYTVRTRFRNSILSSMALRHTDVRTFDGTRIDFNGTVVTNRDLEIQAANGDWVDLLTFALGAIRKQNPMITIPDTELILKLQNYGFDPRGRLPMYLQHLGASEEQFMENSKHFAALGAQPNRDQVRSSAQGQKSKVEYSWRHQEGVPIATMDISKVDRSQSENGTGFIGFLDGALNTFFEIIKFDKKRSAIKGVSPDNEELYLAAQREEAEIRTLFSTARTLRAFRNWGGTTRVERANVLEPGEATKVEYYAQQVPCGRFAVYDDRFGTVGQTQLYSVWRPRAERQEAKAEAALTGENTGTDDKLNQVIPPEVVDEAIGSF